MFVGIMLMTGLRWNKVSTCPPHRLPIHRAVHIRLSRQNIIQPPPAPPFSRDLFSSLPSSSSSPPSAPCDCGPHAHASAVRQQRHVWPRVRLGDLVGGSNYRPFLSISVHPSNPPATMRTVPTPFPYARSSSPFTWNTLLGLPSTGAPNSSHDIEHQP
ncbi:hypothetical protein S7711_06754 [Stachybotrys chartarum IBT 7711]|uniref:Uncharacterized protein n=1 Tax=Stachybotrys chartarum (strain CBS 109288 / IBT 7711) TaxID=1280523 RepID=A0A084B5U7_STACB|nr:hypothetical protein S7711_06754 [Stachybotrys chartarum IBT 7711]